MPANKFSDRTAVNNEGNTEYGLVFYGTGMHQTTRTYVKVGGTVQVGDIIPLFAASFGVPVNYKVLQIVDGSDTPFDQQHPNTVRKFLVLKDIGL